MSDSHEWMRAAASYYPAPGALETDEELRARLLYVGADGEHATRRIGFANGEALDAIAATLRLRRRRK